MGQFIALVTVSLCAGVLLAALACWLTTTRGNRIADIERGTGEAINIQVMERFKLTSSVPIVALFTISVVCAIALPLYFIYINRLDTPVIGLEGTFDEEPHQLSVTPDNLHINGNTFYIPVAVSESEQQFDVNAGQSYAPLTLQTHVISATKQLYFYVNGVREYGPFDIAGSAAHVGRIHLTRIPSISKQSDARVGAISKAPQH